MKKFVFFLFLTSILFVSQGYNIIGSWNLKEIKDYPIIAENVQMALEDFIFRSTEVQQNLIFKGCRSYQYMAEVDQNNIFINYDSFEPINNTQNANCLRDVSLMHSFIQNKLKSIFTFKIFGSILIFLDAKQTMVLRFQRKLNSQSNNLRGEWNIIRLNSRRIEDTIYITNEEILLCQKKLRYTYKINGKYELKTQLNANDGCVSQELSETIGALTFYRRNNNSLEIYDSNVQLKMELSYVKQISTNSSLIGVNQNTNSDQISNTTLTKNSLVGEWQPLSVFGMALNSSSITIIFSLNQVSYNGGCNKYAFQYNVDEAKKTINIGKSSFTSNACQNDQDGLFINAIWKMTKYNFNITNGQLRISDAVGKPLYELKRVGGNSTKQQQQTSQNTSQTQQIMTPQSIDLQNGSYVFLLINRRDLPRKFCTVYDGKITYEGCNTIEHNYKIVNQNQIVISGHILGNKTCTESNDEIFLNAFNSIKSFQKGIQTGSYKLNNAANEAIINLSLF